MRLPLQLRAAPTEQGPPPQSTGTADSHSGGGNGHTRIIVATVLVAVGVIGVIAVYFYLAHLEKKRLGYSVHPWRPWIVKLKTRWSRSKYARAPNDNSDESGRRNGATSSEMSRSSRPTTGAGTTNGVDRNTSIRSIMTLPAYAPAPRPTEQILGREGDRAGIDVVVEYPETAEEEETRREQQMSSLYQIRLARRAEAAEREAQRRLRREARSRGDNTTLEELRVRSRLRAESASSVGGNGGPGASTTSLSSASLIQEHAARERDRRIPSVSYADVGLARHDGSRVRANSNDSDRPLLTSVASTGARSRSGSNLAWHDRTRSATSVLSLSTTNSGGNGNRPPMGDPNGSDFEEISLQPTLASSHGTPPESDIAEARSLIHPDEHPPEYEHVDWGDAPPYEHDNDHFHDIRTSDDVDGDDDDEDTPLGTASRSASDSSSSSNHHDTHRESTSQPPVLPALHTLPAIEITGTTPASSAPPTPVSPHSREPREMS